MQVIAISLLTRWRARTQTGRQTGNHHRRSTQQSAERRRQRQHSELAALIHIVRPVHVTRHKITAIQRRVFKCADSAACVRSSFRNLCSYAIHIYIYIQYIYPSHVQQHMSHCPIGNCLPAPSFFFWRVFQDAACARKELDTALRSALTFMYVRSPHTVHARRTPCGERNGGRARAALTR